MAKRASGSTGAETGEGLTFEAAMARLEEIVERVERGEVGLEEALKEYEAGMGLIKRCKEVLAKAQQRVEELAREGGKESERAS
jgi:exodeoxyribonuclease VII small subunit